MLLAITSLLAFGLSAGRCYAQQNTLALISNGPSDFWIAAGRGIKEAQKEHPEYNMTLVIPNQATAAEQHLKLNGLLAQGVAGISISVDDAPHATDVLNSVADKVPLFTIDSDAPRSKRLAYIGTDNVAAGKQAAGEITKALPDGGKIMLFVGTLDAESARERVQGIRDVLAGSKIEIIDVRTDQVDFAKAKSNVEDTLAKYPDISLLSGLWSYNTPEIYDAVKAAGKCGKIKIVGFGDDPRTLRGISEGCIQSTIIERPFLWGYTSMVDLIKVIHHDRSFIPADGRIIIPTLVEDKDFIANLGPSLECLAPCVYKDNYCDCKK
jgi:ribose transport system substrate-binding protein